jgi:hypothetical protein
VPEKFKVNNTCRVQGSLTLSLIGRAILYLDGRPYDKELDSQHSCLYQNAIFYIEYVDTTETNSNSHSERIPYINTARELRHRRRDKLYPHSSKNRLGYKIREGLRHYKLYIRDRQVRLLKLPFLNTD